MKVKYIAFTGKHPSEKKKDRCYTDKPPRTGDYGASYDARYLKVDIDDFNHKSGELEDPIHGKPRSEAIVKVLDDLGTKYNGIITEHGRHLFFRVPEWLEQKNKINWYSPLGVKMEWKFPVSDDHIPLKVNGAERKFFKGSIDNEDVDELPYFLYPLQKGNKPFELDFPEGGRTQKLGAYLFYLVGKKGYTAEQAFETVRLMNQYIFESSIPNDMLTGQILNDSTFDKLVGMEGENQKKEMNIDTFRRFLSELGMTIRYNELLNIVEFENIPQEYRDVHDVQNVMPIRLQYGFREYAKIKNVSKQQVIDLIVLEGDENSYNPVKEYLQETEWDGVDRFPEIFSILGVQGKFEQSLIRKWFYQTAALPFNTLENSIQPEGVLIFQGDEGIGKTRFFMLMCPFPLWFQSLDKELTTKNKDILIQMLSAWIGEIGEIDRTFKANRSDVKNFMTLTKDSIRKPYAREPVTRARSTSFCGTTNKAEFLNDDTGFRRWWVIPIRQKIDMGEFIRPDNLQQFWAQCYAAYCENPQCFRLTYEEQQELEGRNKEVMETQPAEDELRLRMDFDAPLEMWNWVQPSALKNLYDYDVQRYTSKEIGTAISSIMRDVPDILRKHTNRGTSYFIPPAISNTDRYRNERQ
jgi:hypothetical protein